MGVPASVKVTPPVPNSARTGCASGTAVGPVAALFRPTITPRVFAMKPPALSTRKKFGRPPALPVFTTTPGSGSCA